MCSSLFEGAAHTQRLHVLVFCVMCSTVFVMMAFNSAMHTQDLHAIALCVYLFFVMMVFEKVMLIRAVHMFTDIAINALECMTHRAPTAAIDVLDASKQERSCLRLVFAQSQYAFEFSFPSAYIVYLR